MSWFKKNKPKSPGQQAEVMLESECHPSLPGGGGTQHGIEPFRPETIAKRNRALFETLLPAMVGRVQISRLKTHNEMIRELQATLHELAETKQAWARLQNTEEEIATEQTLAALRFEREQAQLIQEKNKFLRLRQQDDFGRVEDQLQHEKRLAELRAEIEDLQKQRMVKSEEPPQKPTTDEELAELRQKFEVERERLRIEIELEKMEKEFHRNERQKDNKEGELPIGTYIKSRARLDALEKTGEAALPLKEVRRLLDQVYGLDRDEEDIG